MSKHLLPILLSLVFCLLSLSPASIIQVPQDQPGIQAGINAATNGDTVLVADSTYYENINFMGKAITVASYMILDGDTTHRDSNIINGSQPSHADSGSVVFFVSGEDTTSLLYGFTITGGTGTLYDANNRLGGGIYCYYSGSKIIANKIINNTVTSPGAYGGGLATMPLGSTAYVIIRDNQIMHNTITASTEYARGGGLVLRSNGRLISNVISFNSVVNNATYSPAYSGGLDCRSSTSDRRTVIVDSNKITHNSVVCHSTTSPSALGGGVTIDGCQGRFTKNEVSYNQLSVNSDQNGSGAGMEVLDVPATFIIEGNIINENAVTQGTGWGGGLNIFTNASPILINNIIDGNSATNGGGILIGGYSMVKLINNSVVNNQATSGGGIFVGYENSTNYMLNTIIWGNQAATNAGIYIESGSIQVAYSDVQGGWTGTGNINLNPDIVADSLSNVSPCIGSGIHSYDFGSMVCYCPAEDINGRMRPYPAGSDPDMGAWESKEGIVGIESQPLAGIPNFYALFQNYPNPFNPTTTIEFHMPTARSVTLKIYNLLGQEVATLVSEKLKPGNYKYDWNARGFASGIYLYKLTAGDFVEMKKLVLLR